MTICYFGDYDSEYSRNRILLRGLKENGVIVLECRSQKQGLKKYWDLYKKHRGIKNKYDVLIVGQSFHSRLVWLAKILSSKKIVWDAYYSFYDKYVFDSRLISPASLRARYYWWTEKIACVLADLILLDTDEHIKYFSNEFRVTREKFRRVLVGSDIDFKALPEKNSEATFSVFFYGMYTPLQGARYIIKAAKILENERNIKFIMVGSGQTYADDRKLADELGLENISFFSRRPFMELVMAMVQADVCLGVFGNTPKTKRVIPNKVYDAAALGKPIISSDTPAIKEIFVNFKNILLCRPADPADLADKIRELEANDALRSRLGSGAQEIFRESSNSKVIGRQLLETL
ncbi:MAG: glycosyltransferase [Candidatus Portnoybacteria bacterium]|nr:glycosyltransferase [Candidatus Portnoybacteria bacterium]